MLGMIERLIEATAIAETEADFLKHQLTDMCGELGASGAGIFDRSPAWVISAQTGRWNGGELPKDLLANVLDRDAGVSTTDGLTTGSLVAVPVRTKTRGSVLTFTGRHLAAEILPLAVVLGKTLGSCLDVLSDRSRAAQRIECLRGILKVSLTLSTVKETEPLLELIAREAVRILACDRASIFVWDREHQEVVACPALGVEGNSLRLPDRTGVVGEVIHSGKLLRVDDAYHDDRFSKKVDVQTLAKISGHRDLNLLLNVYYRVTSAEISAQLE